MIQHANIHQPKGVTQTPGDMAVSARGMSEPRGMVMRKDHGAGPVVKRSKDYLPGINSCAVQRAGKHILTAQEAMLGIEKQTAKHLATANAQMVL